MSRVYVTDNDYGGKNPIGGAADFGRGSRYHEDSLATIFRAVLNGDWTFAGADHLRPYIAAGPKFAVKAGDGMIAGFYVHLDGDLIEATNVPAAPTGTVETRFHHVKLVRNSLGDVTGIQNLVTTSPLAQSDAMLVGMHDVDDTGTVLTTADLRRFAPNTFGARAFMGFDNLVEQDVSANDKRIFLSGASDNPFGMFSRVDGDAVSSNFGSVAIHQVFGTATYLAWARTRIKSLTGTPSCALRIRKNNTTGLTSHLKSPAAAGDWLFCSLQVVLAGGDYLQMWADTTAAAAAIMLDGDVKTYGRPATEFGVWKVA